MIFWLALFMALLVWIINSVCPMWLKWSVALGAPLVSGLINGIIIGDVAYGLEFGATVMLVFMGVAVIGGAMPSDVTLAGYVGVTVSMLARVEPEVGITVAATLGTLGAISKPFMMTLNSFWVHAADRYAEEGNTKGLIYTNVFAPLVFTFILYFIPCFLIIYFGAPLLDSVMAALPKWIINGLTVTGRLLPALGLAMLMQLLYKRTLIPFFIIGFVLSAYLGLGIMPISIIGAALALMHYMYSKKEGAVTNG